MEIKLSLLTQRPNAKGLCPIRLRVTVGKDINYYRIGKAVSKEDFQRLIKNFRLSTELLLLAEFCKQAIEEFKRQSEIKYPEVTMLSFMYARVELLKKEGREGTASIHNSSARSLEKYNRDRCTKDCKHEGDHPLNYEDITHTFLDEWQTFIGGTKTTRGMYLRELRADLNRIGVDPYPFKGYKIPKGEGRKIALSSEEIVKLWNVDYVPEFSGNQYGHVFVDCGLKARYYRNHWFLLYFMNGMNLVDLCLLKWKDLDGDVVRFTRKKTEQERSDLFPLSHNSEESSSHLQVATLTSFAC